VSAMSFEKTYTNRKDQRRPYRKYNRAVARSCRPHGGCPACANARRVAFVRRNRGEEPRAA
jgi:hypothetical protein